MNNGHATAVLCGDLNMLRCFVKSEVPVIVVSSDPHDVTFHSRYCQHKKVIANTLSEPDKAVHDLIELGSKFSEKPVLFYGDDAMLLLVSRNRERLSKYYRFLLPEVDLVEDLVDKTRFANLASRFGFPAPKMVLSRQVKSAKEIMNYLSTPCVLKPNLRVGWFESKTIMNDGGKPQKVLRANNSDELDIQFTKMLQFTEDFVIQEYIPGGDDCIYSFHAYFNQYSEMLSYYVGRKIRTYPKDSGVSTYLELVNEPEVVKLGLEILKKLKFVGVVKIDFKKDINSNLFYLLEINPRFNLWNYLGTFCGVNLPQVAYRDLLGIASKTQDDYRTGVKWLSFGDDLRAFVREYRHNGELSLLGLVRSYKCKKIYDIFSWDDPYPFILTFAQYSKTFFKQLIKKH